MRRRCISSSVILRLAAISVLLCTQAIRGQEFPRTSADIFEAAEKAGILDKDDNRAELLKIVKYADSALVPAIKSASSIEVFSLDPAKPERFPTGASLFHGYRILGSVVLQPQDRIILLKRRLIAGICPSSAMLCYSPRHGVRIRSKTMGTVDLEICFECVHSRIYGIPAPKDILRITFVGKELRALLNEILDEAGIERDRTAQRE